MGKIVGIGFLVACLACSSSTSKRSTDAAKSDTPTSPAVGDVGPEPRVGDVANEPDLRASDVANGLDTFARDVAVDSAKAVEVGGDTSPRRDLLAVDRGPDSNGAADANLIDGMSRDALALSDLAEQCSCGDTEKSGPAAVSWGCFCSVENCTRTLNDFVDEGYSDRVFKSIETKLMLIYADCNRLLIQNTTYSRTVPASEYVFDRTTKALVGAKVWLDDRQHTCPFPNSGARWVFGYQSGEYPIPSTCKLTSCVAGSGNCPP